MTDCPSDEYLRRVIGGDTAPAVETHLDSCRDCCARLDQLSGVAAVGVNLKASADISNSTPALLSAIARLESSALSFGRGVPADLPPLGPASRAGFIGSLKGIDLRRVLGRGGMGVVYEGYDPALDRKVAVKLLSTYLSRDPESRERFLREGRAAAAITHENVVAVHAIDSSGEVPFMVLQFVEGESLADVLKREGALPADRAAIFGVAVARGLAAAHAKGLIHRDVKPANVLIEAGTGVVRLTDFGLAKVAGTPTLTGAGVVAGTAAYMSPEQAKGRPLDARTDLFSLGAMLYQMVAGRTPFADESPFVVMHKICQEPAPPLPTTVPEWFRAIVFRLLEKDPKRRFAAAADVAEALDRKAAPAAPVTKRRAWVFPAACAAVVVVAVALFQMPRKDKSPGDPPPEPGKAPGVVVEGPRDGGVIELTGDGPHTLPEVGNGRSLTVRAAPGSRPRVVVGDRGNPVADVMNGDLTLEGLVLDATAAARPVNVVLCRGTLSLVRCSVLGGPEGIAVTCDGDATIDRCHIVGKRAVEWIGGGRLSVTNTVLEGEVGVQTAAKHGVNRSATFDRCSFLTDTVVQISTATTTVTPIDVKATRCVFDAPRIMTALHTPTFPRPDSPPTSGEIRAMAKKLVLWSDRGNVYRENVHFLAATAFKKDVQLGDRMQLKEWLMFFGPPQGTATAADIRFAPRPGGRTSGMPVLEFPKTDAGARP